MKTKAVNTLTKLIANLNEFQRWKAVEFTKMKTILEYLSFAVFKRLCIRT